ncbi:hypothetical protein LSPH24S_05236 [Lysinibacillus sphaericus]
MNNSVRGIWQLVNSNRLSKKLTIGTLLLSIVETLIGLTVPLFTMRMINDFSTIGFSWQSILLVGTKTEYNYKNAEKGIRKKC